MIHTPEEQQVIDMLAPYQWYLAQPYVPQEKRYTVVMHFPPHVHEISPDFTKLSEVHDWFDRVTNPSHAHIPDIEKIGDIKCDKCEGTGSVTIKMCAVPCAHCQGSGYDRKKMISEIKRFREMPLKWMTAFQLAAKEIGYLTVNQPHICLLCKDTGEKHGARCPRCDGNSAEIKRLEASLE